jgi:hypothetical protein
MTTNEARSNLKDLKLFLNELEGKVLYLMKVIYEVEDKICDIELTERKFER